MQKVWLDDERQAPEGWLHITSASAVIGMLKQGRVGEMSLDHDLGLEYETGYDVLTWIQEQVFVNNFKPPQIHIHTANPVARQHMVNTLERIKILVEKNQDG